MNLTLYPLGDYIQLLQKEDLLVSAAGAFAAASYPYTTCTTDQVNLRQKASTRSRATAEELHRLSTAVTSWPADINSTMVWAPMYPAPPVTRIFI